MNLSSDPTVDEAMPNVEVSGGAQVPAHGERGRFQPACPLPQRNLHSGSAAEIDADGATLACFDSIIVHCERLRKYFAPYTRVEYLDHHLKFVAEAPLSARTGGPLLWIGNRSNLPSVVDWVNRHPLPGELWVLTDFPSEAEMVSAASLGFREMTSIRVDRWTPERHREWTSLARAALDVKGDDFRARHKPPTKALDFLASGVPLAMNADSSSTEHLRAKYGFQLASLDDHERWLSTEYEEEIRHLMPSLQADLALPVIAQRFLTLMLQLAQPR